MHILLFFKREYHRIILAVVFLCSTVFTTSAQQKHFIIPVDFMVENGTTDRTVVKLMNEGRVVLSEPGKTNMRLKLDFNKSYLISFSKEGYITKSIAVITNAPTERISRPVEPYKIGVKIFKQYEGINIVIYNQPVAKIQFNSQLDEFDYDTDYTKSILSKLNETEQQLEIKAAEERSVTSGTAVDGTLDNNTKQNNNSSSSGQLQEKNLLKEPDAHIQRQSTIREPLNRSADQNKKIAFGTDDNAKNSATAKNEEGKPLLSFQQDKDQHNLQGDQGNELANEKIKPARDNETGNTMHPEQSIDVTAVKLIPGRDFDLANHIGRDDGSDIYNESLRISGNAMYYRTQWKEQGRTITLIKIIHGPTTAEYRKVDYDWGGLYYFKDQYFTISQNVYQWATGEK